VVVACHEDAIDTRRRGCPLCSGGRYDQVGLLMQACKPATGPNGPNMEALWSERVAQAVPDSRSQDIALADATSTVENRAKSEPLAAGANCHFPLEGSMNAPSHH
jgi:ATP phosphoribosyltransferase regulatory subunit HisZ